jgi:SOS-response transcriptional repressor LexA
MYCTRFEISRDFLLFGSGPEQDEYLHDTAEKGGAPINQATDLYKIRSSQYGGVRYIPILTASNLLKLLTGEGNLGAMSQDHLPVPKDLLAGPNSFSLQIPADDQSMIGEGAVSFPPLSFVVIDPDQEIMPGKYALARLSGWQMPILRQYQAAFPYSATSRRYPFELHALNRGVRPIVVNSADECDLIGRVIFVSQAL